MAKSTRFGQQAAKRLLANERWSIAGAARNIGVGEQHLRNALDGRVRPRPEVVDGLSRLLGCEPAALFSEEVLSRPFGVLPWAVSAE
ncbi:helix-turn-helix domain-containing protein [Micromonospora aurantiaca]|uniref:helix-turn-helix domain-containing protein n=1 Tax=Micromonospora aurantiaca (nom. illeg.) TaxID=47850 RepID=UPI0033CA3475